MAGGSYKQVYVKCPFYLHDTQYKLACEGIFDNSTIVRKYNTHADLLRVMDKACCSEYRSCEVYQLLMERKYKGD